MHGYMNDVHNRAINPYCEIHDPWFSGSGPWVGPMWPNIEKV